MASFPTSVWDGDSVDVDSDSGNQSSPSGASFGRVRAEVEAVQTRIYNNERGVDDDTIDSVGVVETVSGLTVVEKGDGSIHKTILTLVDVEVASADGSTHASDGAWGTKKLYTFPEGQIVILGAHQKYPLGKLEAVTGGGSGFSSTADFEIGVGSAVAANAGSFDLDGGTEEDICAAAVVALTSKTSDNIESSVNGGLLPLDGSGGAITANLNFRTVNDADHGIIADVLKVSGTIGIVWTIIGND